MNFALPQIGQAWLNPAVAGLILLCGGRVPAQELATGPPNGTVLTPVRCYANSGPYSGREFNAAEEIGAGHGALLFIHQLTRNGIHTIRALDDFAPLGLSRVEFRGPVTVRYDLVSGPMYFSAEARLSRMARSWGDCELVIRDDEQEVFRARLNAEHPTASIGVALHGSQLTIEITEGSNGPIQDHVVLHRAMLLSAQP